MNTRTASLLLLVLALAGSVGAWRLSLAEESGRESAAETSRIRGWARAEGGAGVSVLPKRVPAADPREIDRLKDRPGFHAYAMRCSSCHVLPDPAAYPGERWGGKVSSMEEHVRRAGLVPAPESELDSVRTFLRAAAETLRED